MHRPISCSGRTAQIALYQPCCLGNSTFTTNGANYHVKGVEVQFIGRLMQGLTLTGVGQLQ